MSINVGIDKSERLDIHTFSGLRIGQLEFAELNRDTFIICENITIAKQIRDAIFDIQERIDTPTEYCFCDDRLNELDVSEIYGRMFSNSIFEQIIIQEEADRIWIQFWKYQVQNIYVTTTAEIVYRAGNPIDICFVGNKVTWLNEFKEWDKLWNDKNYLVKMIRQMRFFF